MKTRRDTTDWRVNFGKKGFRTTDAPVTTRPCDHPGCESVGEFRAPQSRHRLDAYYWFCLDHVREYNANWDYCAGMSTVQIEDEIRSSTTWQRPTWKMNAGKAPAYAHKLHDAFGVMDDDESPSHGPSAPNVFRPAAEAKAMQTLGLSDPLTQVDLKTRYKALVKEYHPDLNGGDRQAEETFKIINSAYTLLMATFETND